MSTGQNVTKQVVEYFINNIQSGNWKIGNKIPSEPALTKELEVSRSSIRAAIQQFVGLGVMESRHGKGTFLISDDLSNFVTVRKAGKTYDFFTLQQILEFRIVLEPECCGLAAERANEDQRERMRFYFGEMKEAVGVPEDFVRYDLLFHEEIARATGNPMLADALHTAFQQKQESAQYFNELFGYKDGIYYHTLILRAIEARDNVQAKRMMYNHLQKAIDDLQYESSVGDDEKAFLHSEP
ncbi:FadR/GntR family transcriptional regulator [Anaerotruncus rubiinfantis]|uniref:FadR/GntR family transcriptional regulator n=1 Tax=Anaerotruncus rubiinfantis TaxID=1720200 RepID=UPI00082FF24D|nr:FadR/GntR family transcriptional regulator [Anaerotruncus rubiinfantis]